MHLLEVDVVEKHVKHVPLSPGVAVAPHPIRCRPVTGGSPAWSPVGLEEEGRQDKGHRVSDAPRRVTFCRGICFLSGWVGKSESFPKLT